MTWRICLLGRSGGGALASQGLEARDTEAESELLCHMHIEFVKANGFGGKLLNFIFLLNESWFSPSSPHESATNLHTNNDKKKKNNNSHENNNKRRKRNMRWSSLSAGNRVRSP